VNTNKREATNNKSFILIVCTYSPRTLPFFKKIANFVLSAL